jgi:cytochrome P450
VHDYIQELEDSGRLNDETSWDVKALAAHFIIAAADTTSSALTMIIRHMVCTPDALRKAHQEMDRVIGSNRLPTFEDRPNLPYLECIVQEVLR